MATHHNSNRRLTAADLPVDFLLTHPKKILLYPLIRAVFPYTQLTYAGLCQMYDILMWLGAHHVHGSIVEMGCGRGGCGAFMARVSRGKQANPLWLFDSFEGLSRPHEADTVGTKKDLEKVTKGYLKVPEESVWEIVDRVAHSERDRVHVIKGWFSETVPAHKHAIGKIAILRLDADLYEPTKYCLQELYDQVVPGGYVVIDDYKKWVGARKALFEFFVERGISPYVKEYPARGVAYFMKEDDHATSKSNT